MTRSFSVIVVFLLWSCAKQPSVSAPSVAVGTADAELARVLRASDEATLERNPAWALERGDRRYAHRYGDFLSDAWAVAERDAARTDLAALDAIDRAGLSEAAQVSYEVLRWKRQLDLEGLEGEVWELRRLLPISHYRSFVDAFALLASGSGAATYATVDDYDAGLSRFDDYVRLLDLATVRLEAGLARGITQPKVIVRRMATMVERAIADIDAGTSLFFRPLGQFPETVSARDQERLRGAYDRAVHERIRPALVRMHALVAGRYLEGARDGEGLVHLPGGLDLYRHLIRRHTTTDIDPADLHAFGLAEVERLESQLTALAREEGYGSLQAFAEHLAEARYVPTSDDEVLEGFLAIGARVDAAAPTLFAQIPRMRLEIRPTPGETSDVAARASYDGGTAGGTIPGVFYFNTKKLTTWAMETLYLHEAVPGHHFQHASAAENEGLPPLQRYDAPTAFSEGWGLYAEQLGGELGLYTDAQQQFGSLESVQFRAVRIVVDTGLHALGWSRDQAVAYILDHSVRPRNLVESEVDRYIGQPGQALAYGVGAAKIRQLRARAAARLGAAFDVRDFHAVVLGSGGLPLPVLDRNVDRWIRSREEPRDLCLVVDTDGALDDLRAVAVASANRDVAAVVVTGGILPVETATRGFERLLAGLHPEIDILSGREVPDRGQFEWLAAVRADLARLNGFPPPSVVGRAPRDLGEALVASTAACRQVEILVLGPWTSFAAYAPLLGPKLRRVVVSGRPFEEMDPQQPEFNCAYDIEACERVSIPSGVRATWVDLPAVGDSSADHVPTEAWIRGFDDAGLAGAVKAIHAEAQGWAGTRLWDDAAALYLVHRGRFRRAGAHVEPTVDGATFHRLVLEAL